ncbi:MAG: acyltransferase 3 [Acidimicrobiales bacterium]|nr:acyltransferase 3 [Acidimicrobiales bacterium]
MTVQPTIPVAGELRPASTPTLRIPALDGIRAVAVVGVLLYHGGISWMSGGYLGVDVFFVLSGFLVTLLLVGEHDRSGRVGLKRFWSRRVRRLLPAQVALLAVVTVVTAIFYREDLYDLRGQVVAALTASTNWYLIATGGSYFSALGRPPVLRHLWSLAIEMQFYVVWPLVFVAAMRRWKEHIERLVIALVVAAVASSVLLAVVFSPSADASRAYYDTFCRLTGLLLGAALALVWRPAALARGDVARQGRVLDMVGVGALGVIVAFMVFANDSSARMYRGGFALLSLAAVFLVAAASHPHTTLASARGLGHPALVAVGVRSYGIYLWHWPIYAITRPGIDVPLSSGAALALRLVGTVVVNEVSFRWVERPWHERRVTLASLLPSRQRFVAWARPAQAFAVGTVLALAVGSASLATAAKSSNAIVTSIKQGEDLIAAHSGAARPVRRVVAAGTTTTAVRTTGPAASATTATTAPVITTAPPPPVGAIPRVTAVGDSVMVGAAGGLYKRFGDKIFIDARVSRQGKVAPSIISSLRAQRGLGDVVLIHLGTNGPLKPEDIAAMVHAAAPTPVVFLTVREGRSWEQNVNDTLAAVVPTLPGARVADWHALANGHNEWFHSDTVHLTSAGIEAYADFILRTLIRTK